MQISTTKLLPIMELQVFMVILPLIPSALVIDTPMQLGAKDVAFPRLNLAFIIFIWQGCF